MRAAVYHAPGVIEPEEVPDPVLDPGDLLVEVSACGVCGSDLDSWRSGAHVAPGQVMGHEFGGRVAAGGESLGLTAGACVTVRPLLPCGECRNCLRGDVQLCDRSISGGIGYGLPGGFAQYVRVPRPRLGLTVFALPDSIDPESAALIEPLSVALRAVRLAQVGPSDVVVVWGLGPIGLGAVAMAAVHQPARIVAVDPSALRRQAAQQLGAGVVVDPTEVDVVEAVRDVTGPGGFGMGAAADVSIECSGAPQAFSGAVKATRHGGRMVLVAHSREPFAVRSGRIIEKELTVRGSFAYRDEFPRVLDLAAAGRVALAPLISHRFALDDVGEAFKVQATPEESLKVVVRP